MMKGEAIEGLAEALGLAGGEEAAVGGLAGMAEAAGLGVLGPAAIPAAFLVAAGANRAAEAWGEWDDIKRARKGRAKRDKVAKKYSGRVPGGSTVSSNMGRLMDDVKHVVGSWTPADWSKIANSLFAKGNSKSNLRMSVANKRAIADRPEQLRDLVMRGLLDAQRTDPNDSLAIDLANTGGSGRAIADILLRTPAFLRTVSDGIAAAQDALGVTLTPSELPFQGQREAYEKKQRDHTAERKQAREEEKEENWWDDPETGGPPDLSEEERQDMIQDLRDAGMTINNNIDNGRLLGVYHSTPEAIDHALDDVFKPSTEEGNYDPKERRQTGISIENIMRSGAQMADKLNQVRMMLEAKGITRERVTNVIDRMMGGNTASGQEEYDPDPVRTRVGQDPSIRPSEEEEEKKRKEDEAAQMSGKQAHPQGKRRRGGASKFFRPQMMYIGDGKSLEPSKDVVEEENARYAQFGWVEPGHSNGNFDNPLWSNTDKNSWLAQSRNAALPAPPKPLGRPWGSDVLFYPAFRGEQTFRDAYDQQPFQAFNDDPWSRGMARQSDFIRDTKGINYPGIAESTYSHRPASIFKPVNFYSFQQ